MTLRTLLLNVRDHTMIVSVGQNNGEKRKRNKLVHNSFHNEPIQVHTLSAAANSSASHLSRYGALPV